MKKIKRYILPFTLLLSFSIFSQTPEIKTRYFYAQGGESINDFLENEVGVPKKTLHNMGYLEKIKKWNPSVDNFDNLAPNQQIYVEIPYNTVLTPKAKSIDAPLAQAPAPKIKPKRKRKIASIPKESTSVQEVEFQNPEAPNSWNLSLFYALSRGSFEEGIQGTSISTVSTQDSPITLGFAASKKLDDTWSYNGSVYGSKLDGGISELDEEVSIPWEIGITSYISYKDERLPFQVYTGLDLERFSSYNTTELVDGARLDTIQHRITFATFGVSKGFRFLGQSFFTKISYSRSVVSSQSRPVAGVDSPMKGSKYIAFLNMLAPNSKNWSYNLFFKQHNLKGATDLVVSRTGIGFGYRF